VHHTPAECVDLDPLNGQSFQVEQTRRVRGDIVVDTLNMRTLEQARDLTLMIRLPRQQP